LDAGCGTGRLTAHLLERLPSGRVIAVDASQNMLQLARQQLVPRFGGRVAFVHADLADLALEEPVDVIFSTATFHWIRNHPRLFGRLYAALKPGGWLVAQCGGGPNLSRLLEHVRARMALPAYAPFFAGWSDLWEFAGAADTADRLRTAGFVDVETGLEAAPTVMPDAERFREFVQTVILRLHLERLPDEELRAGFLDDLTEWAGRGDPPFLLDYWRLNLQGRRPAE
jgi:trans-aconitate methyltransferase